MIVPRVRRLLAGKYGFNETQVNEFCGYFMKRGCEAMEKPLSHEEYLTFQNLGPYVFGYNITMADLCRLFHIFKALETMGLTSLFIKD